MSSSRWLARAISGLAIAGAVMLVGLTGRAQQAPAPAQAPTKGAPPTGVPATAASVAALAFTSDAALVLFTVKAEGAGDFEAFFEKVKEALAQGTKPQHKGMAASWKFFKVVEGAQSGQVLYASVMDPVIVGADYNPVKILGEVMPVEAAALFPKLKDALLSVNRLSLQSAFTMTPSEAQ